MKYYTKSYWIQQLIDFEEAYMKRMEEALAPYRNIAVWHEKTCHTGKKSI